MQRPNSPRLPQVGLFLDFLSASVVSLFPVVSLWQNGATMGKFQSIFFRAPVAVLVVAFLAAACGDSGDPKKTASKLRDYYYTTWKPPSPDWEVLKVRVTKDKTVSVTANINTKALTKAIMERSRMEQMEIARLACPAANADVWKAVNKEQMVGISLSGDAGHIINALCKHPIGAAGR